MTLQYDAAKGQTALMLDTDGDASANATIWLLGDQSGFTNFVA